MKMNTLLLVLPALCSMPVYSLAEEAPQAPAPAALQTEEDDVLSILTGITDKESADAAVQKLQAWEKKTGKTISDLSELPPWLLEDEQSEEQAVINRLKEHGFYGSADLEGFFREDCITPEELQRQIDSQPLTVITPQVQEKEDVPLTEGRKAELTKLAQSVLDCANELAGILESIHDTASADAAAPVLKEIFVAKLIPMSQNVPETDAELEFVLSRFPDGRAQTDKVDDLARKIMEAKYYSSQALEEVFQLMK